jgi:cation/acetate symporter
MSRTGESHRAYTRYLGRVYAWYTLGFMAFVAVLAVLETKGMPRQTIGYVFLAATILLYAAIGILCRTNDAADYYVAGRRVPAIFNGMATGADWMSAASFIGLAGTLYLNGYSGLAFILGWTGGYVLVALLLAPYLRKFGHFTVPDFLGARYGGHVPRAVGIAIAIICSFTYVVAQIYGVGLITTRLTGVDFTVGIFLGLAGILVCSFLGGMKAVTWTQVAQYIVLIIAYLLPVSWLSLNQGGPLLPQLSYGRQLEKLTQLEERLISDPREQEVREIFRQRSAAAERKLADVPKALADGRAALEQAVDDAKAADDFEAIKRAERALERFPKTEVDARTAWSKERSIDVRANAPMRHAEAFPGKDEHTRDVARRNFLALTFCLMVGTAALPHILIRYYTTVSVRETRRSVAWSLFFILLLYVTAPTLAVLVKLIIYQDVVGTTFSSLPAWAQSWGKVDAMLLSIADVNHDGIVQLAEISIGQDVVVLATPEIAGLPYVISGLVAAGGLAAALSTADGLLLTITNALSHDMYYKMIDPQAPTARRVLLSKVLLLVVAVLAALVASKRPADILDLVSAAFSLAAAGLFPALVCGVFWRRATGLAAAVGMLGGFGLSFYYMVQTHPWLRSVFGVGTPLADALWWEIQPYSAGIFGVPVGFLLIFLVSLVTPMPSEPAQRLVDDVRYPDLHPA